MKTSSNSRQAHLESLPANDFDLVADSNSWIVTALRMALIETWGKMGKLNEELGSAREHLTRDTAGDLMRKSLALAIDFKELAHWVYGDRVPWSKEEADQWFLSITTPSFPPSELLLSIRDGIQKRPRGKPASNRMVYIKGLDMQLSGKRVLMREFTDLYCACEKKRHDKHCRESMRQGIMEVRKFLKRHGISIPIRSSDISTPTP